MTGEAVPANGAEAEKPAARRAALHLLGDVLDRRQALDHALESNAAFKSLPARDRAFARMITATSLRRCGQIDDLIVKASDRNELPRPPVLHNLLRLSVAQLFFMAVPDYAVVDSAVRLAEEEGLARQAGFVNAVLRRLAREGQGWLAKQDAARLNTPDWLLKSWIEDYGLRGAAEIAQASLAEAPLDITIKNPGMADYWIQTLEAVLLPTGTLRRAQGGPVHDLPGFDDGMWWVQDVSAALPAQLLGNVEGQMALDLCAAPGGKTAQLAARGAQVIALDRSVQRLKRLEENLRRLRLERQVRVEVGDASVWRPREPASYILLDAPCSATGTIRRHPDIPHLKSEADIQRLATLQARLLDNAYDMLTPGGIMVYCTCSLQKAEGEHQIDAFLTRRPMQRLPVTPAEVGGVEGLITPQGDVRILPFHLAAQGGMDGFFIARLQKSVA